MTEEKRTAKAVSTLLRAAAGRSPGDIPRVLSTEVVAGTRLGADREQGPGERGGAGDLPCSIIRGDLEVEGNRVRDLGEERDEPQRRHDGLDDGHDGVMALDDMGS